MVGSARERLVLGQGQGWKFPNDDDYTEGLRVSLDFPRAVWWGDWLTNRPECWSSKPGEPCRRTTLAIGHSWYTPNEITRPEVLEEDRPYAAWVYVEFAGHVASDKELRTIELAIGMTGKAAHGEALQAGWHCLRGFPPPRGWAHQVKPVPGLIGVIGSWDHQGAWQWSPGSQWRGEINPYYRVSLGNVMTTAGGGAIVRVGWNVQRRWTQKIPDTRSEPKKWDIHGFAGAEARGIGWNAFLQHDTYTPRRLPAITRGVLDWEYGFAAGRGRFFGGFRWVRRSPEYDGGRRSKYGGLFFTLGPK